MVQQSAVLLALSALLLIGCGGSAGAPKSNSGSTARLLASPSSIDFGTVAVGGSATQQGSLTANGEDVSVFSATSGSSEFVLGGLTFPLSLQTGQTIPFTITFKPQLGGAASSNISFTSSAANPTLTEVLNGMGVVASAQHIIQLSWSPSTSASTGGYNLYRSAGSAGPYAKINPAIITLLEYKDETVQGGHTYYYVGTSVDDMGIESTYSNQIKVVVPLP
jgi:hypothetical protein